MDYLRWEKLPQFVLSACQQHDAPGAEARAAFSNSGLQNSAVAERPHEQQKDRLLMLELPKSMRCD